MQTIIDKIRNLIQDNLNTSPHDVFIYTISNLFTLLTPNASSSTILVYKNSVLMGDSNYTFDSNTNRLTYIGVLVSGDTIEVYYSAYIKYSDNEIKSYIRSALLYISTNRYKTFMSKNDLIFPSPSECEENLIALIGRILIIGDIKSYKTPELNIIFRETMSVDEKIRWVILQFKKSPGSIGFVSLDGEIYNEEVC